jgi:hypothetical protein
MSERLAFGLGVACGNAMMIIFVVIAELVR